MHCICKLALHFVSLQFLKKHNGVYTVLQCSCEYTHGDLCEMCGKECLSPFDPEQRKSLNFIHSVAAIFNEIPLSLSLSLSLSLAHHRECVKSHEQEMERAFAIQK